MKTDTRYELLEKLGSGSFATVYRARDNELGREVAVKQIHQQYLDDPAQLERYWKEAQLLASLHHPHIATIFDIDRERGWLIMELMQGNLAERLAGRQIDLRALRNALAHCLRALSYLHAQGILHGDVKPSNMMIDSRKRVKLGDFGLARRASDEEGSLLKGTTKYMAPEVVSEDFGAVGPASDLYSLGFAAYELMCGENFDSLFPGLNAFGRNRQVAWMMWHAAADRKLPEIKRVMENVPDDLAHVIEKLCEKDQARRYKSADEALSDLKVDLKVVGGGDESPPEPARAGDQRRLWIAGGALAVSLLVSLAILFMPRDEGPRTEAAGRRTVAGIVEAVDPEENRIVVVDLETDVPYEYDVGERPRIFLQNERKNVLLRELEAGDYVWVDEQGSDRSVVRIKADRPVPSRGVIQSLDLPRQRLVIELTDGALREELPLRVPESAVLELNGFEQPLNEFQPGDRVTFTHLSDPGERTGRIVNTLEALRTASLVGFVRGYDHASRRMRIEFGRTGNARSVVIPLAADCTVTINGTPADDARALEPGDRIRVQHDAAIHTIEATRSKSLSGVVTAVEIADDILVVKGEDGNEYRLQPAEQAEITLGLASVSLTDLRPYDELQATYQPSLEGDPVATTIDARRPARKDRWAIVVGTQAYADPSLTPLKYALDDARRVYASLTKRYAVADDRALLLLDQTRAELEQRIRDQLGNARRQTQMIVYVTGHAYTDDRGAVFIAGKDFKLSDPAGSGLPLAWLAKELEACAAEDKLLLLDCTHRGGGKDLERQPAAETMLESVAADLETIEAVASCATGESGIDLDDRRGGLFAVTLSQALDGAADADRDLHLTAQELIGYLQAEMKNVTTPAGATQTPVLLPSARDGR